MILLSGTWGAHDRGQLPPGCIRSISKRWSRAQSYLPSWMRDKAIAFPLRAPWVLVSSGFPLSDNVHAVNESVCLGDSFRSNNSKELMLRWPQETRDMQTHFSGLGAKWATRSLLSDSVMSRLLQQSPVAFLRTETIIYCRGVI